MSMILVVILTGPRNRIPRSLRRLLKYQHSLSVQLCSSECLITVELLNSYSQAETIGNMSNIQSAKRIPRLSDGLDFRSQNEIDWVTC